MAWNCHSAFRVFKYETKVEFSSLSGKMFRSRNPRRSSDFKRTLNRVVFCALVRLRQSRHKSYTGRRVNDYYLFFFFTTCIAFMSYEFFNGKCSCDFTPRKRGFPPSSCIPTYAVLVGIRRVCFLLTK